MKSFLSNPVGRKLLTGFTGLALALFVLIHMIGNLAILESHESYNSYAHFLVALGPLLYAIELGLVAVFLLHAVVGFSIYRRKRAARPIGYESYASAGNPSLQSFSSRSMIVTGVILFVFVVIHIWSFKFGPGVDEGYVTTVDGVEMRDLARLMIEKFQQPGYAFGYTAIMLLLAIHLRHGIWSALQSLGAMSPSMTPAVYGAGFIVGVGIAVGFIVLPMAIFFGWVT